jgi:hypothetical protein
MSFFQLFLFYCFNNNNNNNKLEIHDEASIDTISLLNEQYMKGYYYIFKGEIKSLLNKQQSEDNQVDNDDNFSMKK